MPITTIKTAFGPEDTEAMTAAFEDALTRLNVADRKAHIVSRQSYSRRTVSEAGCPLSLFVGFELLDEGSEPEGHGRTKGVVLVA